MKKFVLICFCVLSSVGGYAQNWDINTLHKINSLDSKFARNYSKAFSKSAPYIAVGVPWRWLYMQVSIKIKSC